MSNSINKDIVVNRPTRTPLHKQQNLTATHREGFVRRYVNEEIGRIEAYIKAGWKPVVGSDQNTSDIGANTESQMGSVVRKVVNKDPKASAKYAVLMEIPQEWYESDQKDKQKAIDEFEASYDPQKFATNGKSTYGHMKKEYK